MRNSELFDPIACVLREMPGNLEVDMKWRDQAVTGPALFDDGDQVLGDVQVELDAGNKLMKWFEDRWNEMRRCSAASGVTVFSNFLRWSEAIICPFASAGTWSTLTPHFSATVFNVANPPSKGTRILSPTCGQFQPTVASVKRGRHSCARSGRWRTRSGRWRRGGVAAFASVG